MLESDIAVNNQTDFKRFTVPKNTVGLRFPRKKVFLVMKDCRLDFFYETSRKTFYYSYMKVFSVVCPYMTSKQNQTFWSIESLYKII